MSQAFCTRCGTAIAAGSASCPACGAPIQAVGAPVDHYAQFPSAPDDALPPPLASPPPAPGAMPPKRPLTFGQKILVGLFLIGFALVSFVITEAQIRARHPHYHHY